ncbi:MAG: Asp23/Gls24 family envelope stress response protein [Atopobiaceae bacterium]
MATAASDQQKQTDATQDPAEEPTSQDIVADDEDLDSEDSLTFSNGVIEKIVAIAMRDVPGVVGMKGGWLNSVQEAFGQADPRKGVSVEVTPDSSVRVNISVLMEYGAYAPKVFEDVKKTVVKQVTGMTGLEIAGVNLRIEDVLTPEEYNSRKNEESHPAEGAQLPAADAQAAQQATAAPSTTAQKEA